MKKIASILILVFAFTLTTQAQKRGKRMQKEQMTVAQQTTLAVKKMTLALELSDAQQRKITPLISAQITDRRAQFEKMKKFKEEKKMPSAEERYKNQNSRLDKQIAFQTEMKSILNKEQYEKFQKMAKARKRGAREKMQKRRKMKWLKERKERQEDDN
jgi:hypothetical protein